MHYMLLLQQVIGGAFRRLQCEGNESWDII